MTRHLAVLGPTCSWKSATAILAAQRLGAEIVNCDSMQVYRGLDIGTAKPTPEDRVRVPHHLIDCLGITDACDAAAYVSMAEACLDKIEGRGYVAILTGGTGLYARSLIYGLRLLPSDDGLARGLQAELSAPGGQDALRKEIVLRAGTSEQVPAAILENPRRLLRAVEVLRLTGEVPWVLHRRCAAAPRHAFDQYILLPEMAVLKPRIAARTAAMLQAGWIEEARRVLDMGLLDTPTARQALGYAEIAAFLAGHTDGLSALEETIVRRTVAYARRQRTWFRHQHPGAVTVHILRQTDPDELADVILRHHGQEHAAGGDPGDRQNIVVR